MADVGTGEGGPIQTVLLISTPDRIKSEQDSGLLSAYSMVNEKGMVTRVEGTSLTMTASGLNIKSGIRGENSTILGAVAVREDGKERIFYFPVKPFNIDADVLIPEVRSPQTEVAVSTKEFPFEEIDLKSLEDSIRTVVFPEAPKTGDQFWKHLFTGREIPPSVREVIDKTPTENQNELKKRAEGAYIHIQGLRD